MSNEKHRLQIIYFTDGGVQVLKVCPSYVNIMVSSDGEIIVRNGTQRKSYVSIVAGKTPVKCVRVSPTASQAVARLVADAWLAKPARIKKLEESGGNPMVIHLDGNSLNNHYQNLRWATVEDFNKNQAKNRKGVGGIHTKYPLLLRTIMVDIAIVHGNAQAIDGTGIGADYFSNMKSAMLKDSRAERTARLEGVNFGCLNAKQVYDIAICLKRKPNSFNELLSKYFLTSERLNAIRNLYVNKKSPYL